MILNVLVVISWSFSRTDDLLFFLAEYFRPSVYTFDNTACDRNYNGYQKNQGGNDSDKRHVLLDKALIQFNFLRHLAWVGVIGFSSTIFCLVGAWIILSIAIILILTIILILILAIILRIIFVVFILIFNDRVHKIFFKYFLN